MYVFVKTHRKVENKQVSCISHFFYSEWLHKEASYDDDGDEKGTMFIKVSKSSFDWLSLTFRTQTEPIFTFGISKDSLMFIAWCLLIISLWTSIIPESGIGEEVLNQKSSWKWWQSSTDTCSQTPTLILTWRL